MQIDHVTVCGIDLERMRAEFATAGITTVYGGMHANRATHMALAGFADGSYLELIAPVGGTDTSHASGMMAEWLPLMLDNAGPGAWAIRTKEIHAIVLDLRKRNLEVRGPDRGGRAKPDGTRLEWETAEVGPLPAGSMLPFMIEDITERRLRVETGEHSHGIAGVEKVILSVQDLDRAVRLFQLAYGWEAPVVEEPEDYNARMAWFAGTPVVLAHGRNGSWIQERVERWGEGPVGFVLKAAGRSKPGQVRTGFGKRVDWFDLSVAWIGLTE
jgi:hypothetical protein